MMIRWGWGQICLSLFISLFAFGLAHARSKKRVVSVNYNRASTAKYSKKQKVLRQAVRRSQHQRIRETRFENKIAYIEIEKMKNHTVVAKARRRVARKPASSKLPEKKALPRDPADSNPIVEVVDENSLIQAYQKNIRIDLDDDYLDERFGP